MWPWNHVIQRNKPFVSSMTFDWTVCCQHLEKCISYNESFEYTHFPFSLSLCNLQSIDNYYRCNETFECYQQFRAVEKNRLGWNICWSFGVEIFSYNHIELNCVWLLSDTRMLCFWWFIHVNDNLYPGNNSMRSFQKITPRYVQLQHGSTCIICCNALRL